MTDLLNTIGQQLDPATIQQMSQQLGMEPEKTQQAIGAALPMLLGGLARNANQSPQGAQALASALERDHDGSVLDQLGSLLGGGGGQAGLGGLLGAAAGALLGGNQRAVDGDGILGHILGSKRAPVENGLGRAFGIDAAQAGKLLAMLAPVIMGAVGRMKREQNLDADGITAMLNRERAEVEQQAPGMQQGGLLSVLDRDGDGQIVDDVAKIGSVLGGMMLAKNMFGKRG